MEPLSRNSEQPQQRENSGTPLLLNLPELGHQRSLQALIEDDLYFQGDQSSNIAAVHTRRDEDLGLGEVTVEAPAEDARDESHRCSTSGEGSDKGQKTTDAPRSTSRRHRSLWRRVFKRKKAKSEEPKTVFSHKRRQVLREVIMVHFLPVAVNMTLLGLYLQRVYWTPPWPTTNVLNALQFAAKFHETLMVASLVHVLLHHIRHRLLCSGHRGLPLGIITSPFRLLDITYLWSREFLASIRILGGFRFAEIITIVIHVFLFALAAVLGPASAIIMIPRLGEWDIAQTITKAPFYSLQDRLPIYQAYIGADLSEVFPKAIPASLIPEACDHGNLSLPQTNVCARIGLTDILQGLLLFETGDDFYNRLSPQEWTDAVFEFNITVQSHFQDIPTRSITFETYAFHRSLAERDVEFIVDVTTSTDAILLLTQSMINHYLGSWTTVLEDAGSTYQTRNSFIGGGEWAAQFISNAGDVSSHWKQPYVSSYCSEPGVGSTVSNSLTFIFADFAQQNDTKPYIVTLDTKLLSTVLGDKDMGFIDILDLNITPSYILSAALVFASQSHTTLCLVQAYWIESTLSASSFHYPDGSTGSSLTWDWQAAESGPLRCDGCRFRDETAWFDQANTTEIIHLEVEWLEVLDRGTGSDSTGQYSFFDELRRVCSGSSALADDTVNSTRNHPSLNCFAAGLGAGIAEGLSKMPYNVEIYALGSTEEMPDDLYNALALSPWTCSSSLTNIYRYLGFSGNWTNSTLTPAQIKKNSTPLDFTITQKHYGYNFSGITITLAFVVVSLYTATILIHVCIMTFGTGWSSRSWKSLGEFFVLGLQSPTSATALNNTGGGVKVSKTWQARVSVKELEHGRRVGVVIAEPGQADSGEGSTSTVRPGWKYS